MFKRRESGKTTSEMLEEIRNQVSSSSSNTTFPSSSDENSSNKIAEQINNKTASSMPNDDSDILESILLNEEHHDIKDNQSIKIEEDLDLIEEATDDIKEDKGKIEPDNKTENIESNNFKEENLEENSDEEDEDMLLEADEIETKNSEENITFASNQKEQLDKNKSSSSQDLSKASFINPIYKNINSNQLQNQEYRQPENEKSSSFIDTNSNKSISKLIDIVKKQAGKLTVERNTNTMSMEEFMFSAISPKLDAYIDKFMKENLAKIVERKVQEIVEIEIKRITDS